MTSKEEAKSIIQQIVDDFERNRSYYQKTDEANIESKLLEPLFEALGWNKKDFEKRPKLKRKEGRGIADYAFKIKDRTVFFLEAKKVSIDIDKDKETWKQAKSYALSKTVPFAILSNFETLKIFCVESKDIISSQLRSLKYNEFLPRFDDLWLLSKESFENNQIMRIAINEQRLKERITLGSELLEDLIHVSREIVNNIEKKHPNKYELNDKEAIAQRILDRLIFIRRAEDIGINNDKDGKEIETLKEISNLSDNKVFPKLKELFTKYDVVYNSGLFKKDYDNDADSISLDGDIIKKLIPHLYETKNRTYIYNFDWIDADIMGQVYEQYLGTILQQAKSGMSRLKDGQTHKKSQGVYYTPVPIVDYIVRSTIGEMLKNKKVDVSNIKALDAACGSGSFLIKAFDVFNEHYKKTTDYAQKTLGYDGTTYSTKEKIIKQNIFGIDLDRKAVEIAQLNLLLKIAEKGHRLPLLQENIRCGNSLLKGLNEQGVLKSNSFDIVVGNPPYLDSEEMVRSQPEQRKAYKTMYSVAEGNWDIFCLFIQRGLELIKEGGYFGMIVPNKLLSADYAIATRKFIQNYKIIAIRDYSRIPVFKASVYPIVIIIKKEKPKENNVIAQLMEEDIDFAKVGFSRTIKQSELPKTAQDTWSHIFEEAGSLIIDKILKGSVNLKEKADVSGAASVSEAYELKKIIKELAKQKNYFKFINSGTIDRYSTLWGNKKTKYIKVSFEKPIASKTELKSFMVNRYNDSMSPKIIISGMNKRLECFLDVDGQYMAGKSTTIVKGKASDLKPILAILNSKLMTFCYKNIFKSLSLNDGCFRVGSPQIRSLPIKPFTDRQNKVLSDLADEMLSLNARLNRIGNKNTYETAEIKEKIDKVDIEIDKIVYEIYGITIKEQKAIQESLESYGCI